jgi:hypothetical protein
MRSALLACLVVVFVGDEPPPEKPGTPGQAAAHVPAGRGEFKVIVWFRRDRPLETFKYQSYDLRKGEYTDGVAAWLELMRTKYPTYEVIVRDVSLSQEKGATESLKVGSVIKRELLAAAALEGVFIGEPVPRGFARPPRLRPGPIETFDMLRRAPPIRPGQPGSMNLNPPGASFPFPVPYPKPHP